MLYELIKNILSLKKSYRKFILIIIDYILVFTSFFFCSLILKEDQTLFISDLNIFIYSLITIIFYSSTGLYRSLTRFTAGSVFVYKLALRNLIFIFFFITFKQFTSVFTWEFIFLNWLFLTISLSSYRVFLRDILQEIFKNYKYKKSNKKIQIAIFGAGIKGYQIYKALQLSEKYELKFFIEDDSSLYGKNIFSTKIIPLNKLENYYSDIEQVFVSLSSLNTSKIKRLINKLNELNLEVMVIPSIDDIGLNNSLIERLRPISIDDLLGRERVLPDIKLLKKGVEGLVVFITGAGGSIGAQLTKEICMLSPKKIILMDNSEFNLYKIEQDISSIKNLNNKTFTYLGNVCDELLVQSIFKKHNVDIVFHTAAYKHVPLVETNPIVGIENNLLSTISVCEAAKLQSIKKLIYISSDKSVRPSNIMGASKRLSEMVIQSYSEDENAKNTCYSMVRFGNVLGSSGSAVPLFKKQISKGGPVTVTHPNVVRYFMTIKEASQLVIQASTLSKGGEVFLLDMGKPIRIRDLAEQMINLSGKKLKNEKNPDGDIEIKYIGLREGEKLYEELLIDSKSIPTNHPLIYYGNESFIGNEEFIQLLNKLKIALMDKKLNETFYYLSKLVPDWKK